MKKMMMMIIMMVMMVTTVMMMMKSRMTMKIMMIAMWPSSNLFSSKTHQTSDLMVRMKMMMMMMMMMMMTVVAMTMKTMMMMMIMVMRDLIFGNESRKHFNNHVTIITAFRALWPSSNLSRSKTHQT